MLLEGTIIAGHGAASGQGNDPRYPNGTLNLQIPHFEALGIDISAYYPGTVNVDLGDKTIHPVNPKYKAMGIRWSSYIPPENFFFFDVRVRFKGHIYQGLVYMPDPATKTDHFQDPSMLELLLPEIPGIESGKSISLEIEEAQLRIQ